MVLERTDPSTGLSWLTNVGGNTIQCRIGSSSSVKACHPSLGATCAGAYESGVEVGQGTTDDPNASSPGESMSTDGYEVRALTNIDGHLGQQARAIYEEAFPEDERVPWETLEIFTRE